MNKKNRSFKKNETGMELPINIVVMLVVGMVALAALLAIIPESKKSLVVQIENVDGNDGITADITNGNNQDFNVDLIVLDSKNNPVEGASVIISGGGGQGSAKTGADGKVTVAVSDVLIRTNQDSIDLRVVAKANGFYEYRDETAILIT
jgi:hypothetical protein